MTKKNKKLPKSIYIQGNSYRVIKPSVCEPKSFSFKKYGSYELALAAAKAYLSEKEKLFQITKVKEQNNKGKCSVEQAFNNSLELYGRTKTTNLKLTKIFNKYFGKYKDKQVAKLKAADVYKMLNDLAKEGNVSQDTLSRVKSIWSQLLNAAILNDIPVTNYADAIPLPRIKTISEKREVMTDSDTFYKVIDCLNESIEHSMLKRIKFDTKLIVYSLLIMYETGIRPSECYALSVDKLDFDKKLITINCRIGSTQKEQDVIVKPKTDNAYRTVPMTDQCILVLKSLMEFTDKFYLFTRYNGKFMTSTIATDRIRNCCKPKGIDFRPYMLRHKFAKNIIDAGISPRTAMDLLGHASFSQSLDYSRTTQEELIEAVSKLKS